MLNPWYSERKENPFYYNTRNTSIGEAQKQLHWTYCIVTKITGGRARNYNTVINVWDPGGREALCK